MGQELATMVGLPTDLCPRRSSATTTRLLRGRRATLSLSICGVGLIELRAEGLDDVEVEEAEDVVQEFTEVVEPPVRVRRWNRARAVRMRLIKLMVIVNYY